MLLTSILILAALAACGATEIAVRGLQLHSMIKSNGKPIPDQSRLGAMANLADPSSFVSVHVATYNEPPSLVIATMKALNASQFGNFEVIVVDNNTDDPNLWTPVADAAGELGPRFKFVHIDRLPGAKAGALNVALDRADPRTTHVAIVDADYQVSPAFLIDGVRSLADSGADYIQFPQAYRGVGSAARGIEHELGDYFACFSSGVGRAGSMLPTGTLSIFRLSALRAVQGWPTKTITEDAEIGVRLQAKGFRGLWAARQQGHGLLPVDFRGLKKQRARWAAGNLQVLKGLYARRWPELRFGEFVNLIAQLTAWLTLWLPPSAALVVVALVPAFPLSRAISDVSAATILGSAVLTAARMMIASQGKRVDWRVRLDSLATKLALTWVSAVAWMPALSTRALRFHRTGKSIGAGAGAEPVLAVVSCAFLGLGIVYAFRGQGLEATACGLLASAWVCARGVDARLRRAARSNPELR